jgi:hypothetical protein
VAQRVFCVLVFIALAEQFAHRVGASSSANYSAC